MATALQAKSPSAPQAAWTRDGERWAILVPPDLAKAGERVTVARADGSHVREVTISTVTEREWKGMIVCTIE